MDLLAQGRIVHGHGLLKQMCCMMNLQVDPAGVGRAPIHVQRDRGGTHRRLDLLKQRLDLKKRVEQEEVHDYPA